MILQYWPALRHFSPQLRLAWTYPAGHVFAAPALVDMIARMSESREAVVPVPPLPLATFMDMVKDRDRDAQGKEELKKALDQQR